MAEEGRKFVDTEKRMYMRRSKNPSYLIWFSPEGKFLFSTKASDVVALITGERDYAVITSMKKVDK